MVRIFCCFKVKSAIKIHPGGNYELSRKYFLELSNNPDLNLFMDRFDDVDNGNVFCYQQHVPYVPCNGSPLTLESNESYLVMDSINFQSKQRSLSEQNIDRWLDDLDQSIPAVTVSKPFARVISSCSLVHFFS